MTLTLIANMNERIKELMKQADYPAPELALRAHKLAELIIQECAEQIIAKGTDWVDFAPSQTGVRPEYWNMAQQIKQHLGVEE